MTTTDNIKTTAEQDLPPHEPPAGSATEQTPSDISGKADELLRELGTLRAELTSMRDELSAARGAIANVPPTPGALSGAPTTLLSPGEVRAMSRSEVRANLDRIRESMRHWT